MSYLDHPCRACGHQQLWHTERTCSYGACRCHLAIGEFGASRVYVTRDPATNQVIERLTEPGQPIFYPTDRACACQECRDAYGARAW